MAVKPVRRMAKAGAWSRKEMTRRPEVLCTTED
jgi:hypothetical protein